MDKDELIDALENTDTANIALDAKIAKQMGLIPSGSDWQKTGEYTWHKNLSWRYGTATFDDSYQPKPFTKSIDAAITLIPKGSLWSVCDMEDGPFAQIIRPMGDQGFCGGLTHAGHKGSASIAICIAALKATT